MIIILFRIIALIAVMFFLLLIAWKFIKKELVISDKEDELETQLMIIEKEIKLAEIIKDNKALAEFKKARTKIKQTLKETKRK